MKKIFSVIIVAILCLSMFVPLVPKAKANSALSDNFTQDTSLNTEVWIVNGAIGDSAAPLIFCGGGSPVSPVLSFSTSNGMGVGGANSNYEFSTIVSQTSFTPPFAVQAVVFGSSSFGNTFVLALTTADGSRGVSVQGNLNPNNYLYYGINLNTGPGSASSWNSQGLYTSPSINVRYTLGCTVDASGSASVTLSSQGSTLATGTVQIGTGPFYVLLGQGEGYPVVSGPNQAYWQSVVLTSGQVAPPGQVTPPSVVPSGILDWVAVTLTNTQSSATPSPFDQMIQIVSTQYSQYEAPNLQNVEFFDGNGAVIPSWLESGNSNTATNTIYWLKLPSIPANSQVTIYMGFASSSVNFFNAPAQTIGEAPQLSSVYGQYDDGANVFTNYQGFASSNPNPPPGWYSSGNGNPNWDWTYVNFQDDWHVCDVNGNAFGYQVAYAGSNIPINNQLAVDIQVTYVQTYGTDWQAPFVNSASPTSYAPQGDAVTWLDNHAAGNTYNAGATFSLTSGPGGSAILSSSGTFPPNVITVTDTSVSSNYATVISNQNGILAHNGYLALSTISSSLYGSVIQGYWVRTRACPPNGVMPSASISNVSPVQTYSVSFTESGLPSGNTWTATLDGATQTTSNSVITFNEANGAYSFSVSSSGYTASPISTGTVTVEGITNVEITWLNSLFQGEIDEFGLRSGSSWSVAFGSISMSSSTNSLKFNAASGAIYDFSASSSGYVATPSPSRFFSPTTYVIFIPTSQSGTSILTKWDAVKNSYSIANFGGVDWSPDGFCYGFASTALLYFMHYSKLDDTYPRFPFQSTSATSTWDLDLSTFYPTINNAGLAIIFHQLYDPNNNIPTGSVDAEYEVSQFNNLKQSLQEGNPAVLGIWVPGSASARATCHAVLAWGVGVLASGTYALDIYDPDRPGSTQVATFDPGTGAFSYFVSSQGSTSFQYFKVVGTPTDIKGFLNSPLLFNLGKFWSGLLSGHWTGGITGYDIVVADKNVKIISPEVSYLTYGSIPPNSMEDYFTVWGNSQSFIGQIQGSSGVEEGNAQVYAIPSDLAGGFSIQDPATNKSMIMITHVDYESGLPVGYGYLLEATAMEGSLNYTITPSNSDLRINAGDNSLIANVTFLCVTQQDHSVFQAQATQLGPMQEVNFTVTNWQMLNSTNPLPVTQTTSDVAVISMSPGENWTYQGRTIDVNVTVTNIGDYAENATVNLYFNGTAGNGLIGTQIVALAPNETETLTFTWNTTGVPICYSGYSMTAFADISPEIDSNMTNNVLQSAVAIQVRILGDLNGDGKVDGKDIALAAWSFGSCGPDFLCAGSPPSARWNCECDINMDNKIDGKDLVMIAKNFGK